MTSEPFSTAECRTGLRTGRAAVLSVIAVAAAYGVVLALLRLPGVPYNVRELFAPDYLHVRVAAFCIMLVWTCFAPAWIAQLIIGRPRQWPLLPLWVAGVSLVAWFLLKLSVTRESLWDILGSPVWHWPGDLELMYRFEALHGQFVLTAAAVSVAVAVAGANAGKGLRRGARAMLWALPWQIAAWMVVTTWASTDNLTELIRSKPLPWIGPVALAVLVAVLAGNAAALARAVTGAKRSHMVIAAAMTLLLVAPGWLLLQLGLEPAVEKYGLTFPAVRFLLGASRQADLSRLELLLRWSAVQLAIVAAMTWGQLIAMSLSPSHSSAQTR